jgi:putative drug exporter of the RND superfamily
VAASTRVQRPDAVAPLAPRAADAAVRGGRGSRAFAASVGAARFPIVVLLVAAAVASVRYLPGVASLPDSGVRALLPANTAAERAETEAARLFGSSLLPRIAVVQRDPAGLSPAAQRRIVRLAVRLDEGRLPQFPRGSRALPYLNTRRLLPGSRESSTAAITYLAFPSSLSPQDQRKYADRYAGAVSLPGAPADATGFVPGSVTQSIEIAHGLRWVELASVLLVAAILGLYFRAVLAPLVTLAAAGIAYAISIGVVSWLAGVSDVRLDREVEPIVVVLLLGVVTDYSVFFLAGMRGRLAEGEAPCDAASRATAEVVPIVFTAGLLVAAGLATLRLAGIGFVQTLGPAMGVVVLVSLGVSIAFVPAAMRILGAALFWPGLRRDRAEPRAALAGAAMRRVVARGASRRLVAAPVAILVLAGLAAAAWGLAWTRLALTPIRALPAGSAPARGAAEAGRGFAAGMVAPTELVLESPGIGARRGVLREFGRELAARPEVGAVLGAGARLPRRYTPALRARSGNAVRYFVAFRDEPYSAAGVADLGRLEHALPELLGRAGLPRGRTSVLVAGDTALARETIAQVDRDLLRVGLAAALVNLILLALFLRSLVAPLLLVASSALAIAATFGLTTLVFRDFLGDPDLTYFVPLAVGVLLLSFGTDYNLFVVGRIWQEARDRPTAEAVRTAVPRAGRAISIAGVALAGSFAMLALVPVATFREFAVAIAIGVVIDTFVVRTLLIPALLTSLGERSWWPGARGAGPRVRPGRERVAR